MTRTSSLDLAHSAVDHEFDSSDETGLIGCREGAAAAISLDQPDRPGRIGCVEEMAAAARAVFGQQTGIPMISRCSRLYLSMRKLL